MNSLSSSRVAFEPVISTTICDPFEISGTFLLRSAAKAAAPDGSTTKPPS